MKLPNGYGSVYKLSGNRRKPYVARITTGWKLNEKTQKVEPVYKFLGSYKTRAQGLQALAEYHNDPIKFCTITFKEVYYQWSEIKFTTVSESSASKYDKWFNWCEDLHDLPLSSITLKDLQKVADESGKSKDNKRYYKFLLNGIYNYAISNEYIPSDKIYILKGLDLSQGEVKKQPHKMFNSNEIKKLWKHQKEENVQTVLMLLYSGVRISELLELKKENVHLEERYFFIERSKTQAGIRNVPIADKVFPFFEKCMKNKTEYLIDLTGSGQTDPYKAYLDDVWKPVMKRLKMKHTPHDARHTFISKLTMAGVDERIIQSIVGHKGNNVTQEVYTHIELPVQLDEINKI